MKTNLFCPQCHVELLEHPAGKCLNYWVAKEVTSHDDWQSPIVWQRYSDLVEPAWVLMEKVWELDPCAQIARNVIHLSAFINNNLGSPLFMSIEGDSFPLRVCMAAVLLTNIRKQS